MRRTDYVLGDSSAPETRHRFAHLEALYDGVTTAQLDHQIGVREGWRCWEVGCGSGSVATWLAGRVGQLGQVFATDLDTHLVSLPARSLCTVLEHDVVTDPPPGINLDLVHVRLVASHLPSTVWPATLAKLIDCLTPGGWLVIEELDPLFRYQPAGLPTDLVNVVGDAFTRVLASRGGNPHLGGALHGQLRAHRLANVAAHGYVHTGTGRSVVAQLMYANVLQMTPQLEREGITGEQIDDYLDAMNDPDTTLCMPVFWTVRGQK